jgi:O-antigen/teichoic acid export membrane protein
VFLLAGPVDAGRLGMSLVAAQGVLTIGISVMRAKAPTLGRLIAAQDWPQLGRVWQRALHQTLAITALGSLMVPSLGFALETYLPAFALRVLPSQLLAVLAVATVINGASQATAVYLRAYREEPLMWASVGVAALSVPLNLLAIRLLGPAGTCLAFLVIAIFNYLWTMRVMVQRKASRAALQLVVEGAPAA